MIPDPLHNTIAALRYISDKYGSPYNLPRGGYALGGIVPFDGPAFLHKREMVLPKDIGDLIRRAVRTDVALRGLDKMSVRGFAVSPSRSAPSEPALTPIPAVARDARESVPGVDGGITLEMHAHFEVGSISGVTDVNQLSPVRSQGDGPGVPSDCEGDDPLG